MTLASCILAGSGFAQTINFPKPREERLLNDLKVLIWNQPDSDKITVKIRIHSGSAFDPIGKEGTIALLSEILFPDEGIIQLFEEDLEGSIKIESNYDFIQINATAKADEFLTILETIAPALLNPRIDKEITEKVKIKRLERIKKLESDSTYRAERSVAKKLLGEFPYGRNREGTTQSLSKIDFADILFAQKKFLTSDNATIAVVGNIKSNFAFRAIKRHFGGWIKNTEKIPSSFRLPDSPDVTPDTLRAIGDDESEAHYAINGFARNDPAFFSSMVLVKILDSRLRGISDTDSRLTDSSVRHDSHLLRGLFFVRLRMRAGGATGFEGESSLYRKMLGDPITQSEFNKGKSAAISEFIKRDLSDLWFDIATYRLRSVTDDWNKVNSVKIESVQIIANQIKEEPAAQAFVLFEKESTSLIQDPDTKDPR